MGDLLQFKIPEKKKLCQMATIRGNGVCETLALDTDFLMSVNDKVDDIIEEGMSQVEGLDLDYFILHEVLPSGKGHCYVDS